MLVNLEQTLKQLGPYIRKNPLTPTEREHAITLHLKALTECQVAMQEQQASQEESVVQKLESIEDIVNTIRIEVQQRLVVL